MLAYGALGPEFDGAGELIPSAFCVSTSDASDCRYLKVNQAYLDLVGREWSEIAQGALSDHAAVESEARRRRFHILETVGSFHLEDVDLRHASGQLVPTLISAHRRVVAGRSVDIEIIQDNSKRRAYEQQISRAAFNDHLTGLPNRYAFDRTLAATIATRRNDETIGLAFIDLNGFKSVNDSHGHAVGDALLRLFALRLRSRSKTADFVARLGGDEFALLFKVRKGRESDVERHFERLTSDLCQVASVSDIRIEFGAAVGVALATAWTSAERILNKADQLMYQSKRTGQRIAVNVVAN